jgi:hypothetical protein
MTAKQLWRVGVISDTHGLLRAAALDALRGSDLLIHGGDIGSPEILSQLQTIAPVRSVRGNNDRAPWGKQLPLTDVIELGSSLIYLVHDIADLDLDPVAAGIGAVVFGHSHKPTQRRERGVLFFNPGSAGPRRFRLPVSVGRLTVTPERIDGEIVTLA